MNKQRLRHEFAGLFFPNYCSVCTQKLTFAEQEICLKCLVDLPKTNNFKEIDNLVEIHLAGRFPFERIATFSYFSKQGALQPLMHDLKYNGKKEIGFFLGKIFGKDLLGSDFIKPIHLIIPVPLHPKKEKKRGYNQAQMIAEGLSQTTNIPVSSQNLIRAIYNPTQTKLSGQQRWKNVEGIFSIQNPEELQNKHILLVDDIITTGSTLEACAHALNICKNIKISIAALGQTL